MIRNFKFIALLLILLSIPSVIGLLQSGFPLTDDGNWMVIRFSAFYESLRDGQLPVRFLMRLNNGYGYPVADFLYPLFMYFATPLHILGLSFVESIKAVLALSLVFSSLFTFLWLRKFFDNLSSFVGSLIYVYLPYHLLDVYKRGSVGEALSLSVLPFVLWQIEKGSLFLSSIGISLLILSHNSLAVLFLGLIVIYMGLNIYVSSKRKNLIYKNLGILGFGFAMSSFFWIPAVFDLQYTVFTQTKISEYSSYFANEKLVGVVSILVILLTILFIFTKKLNITKHRLTIVMLIVSLVSIFFATPFSAALWNMLPVTFIQFPFRFLSLTLISISFQAAAVTSVLDKKTKVVVAVLLLGLTYYFSLPFAKVYQSQNYPDTFYSTNQDTTTVKNEYMPKWVKNIPAQMYKAKVENTTGIEPINLISNTPNKTGFEVDLNSPKIIRVNTVYFPGWSAYVNGQRVNIDYLKDGLINLNLNEGKNSVLVIFGETNVRILSDIISVASLGMLILLTFYFRKRRIWI
ncbi:MAG: hypothetical protein HY344_02080 [Candidatus Levybacteria bacterium]|nr:hypothetical protein [Candidatus Levybacteria bacterium]